MDSPTPASTLPSLPLSSTPKSDLASWVGSRKGWVDVAASGWCSDEDLSDVPSVGKDVIKVHVPVLTPKHGGKKGRGGRSSLQPGRSKMPFDLDPKNAAATRLAFGLGVSHSNRSHAKVTGSRTAIPSAKVTSSHPANHATDASAKVGGSVSSADVPSIGVIPTKRSKGTRTTPTVKVTVSHNALPANHAFHANHANQASNGPALGGGSTWSPFSAHSQVITVVSFDTQQYLVGSLLWMFGCPVLAPMYSFGKSGCLPCPPVLHWLLPWAECARRRALTCG